MSSEDIEEVIAWHEAAHGRVSEIVGGWPVTDMQVDGDDESGVTEMDIPGEGLHDLSDAELEAYMSVCAAGQAGAAYCYTKDGCSYEDAMFLAEEGTGSDRDDFDEAAACLGSDDTFDEYATDMYGFVKDHENVIAADVESLTDNDYRLSGLEPHESCSGGCCQ